MAAVGPRLRASPKPRRSALADVAHNFELVALATLFLLTATFGRSFSKLGIGLPWLHPTEIVLVAVGVSAVIATPRRELVDHLRRTRVLVPLIALWVIGAVATVRGLGSWGFDRVLHDVGLIEYSMVIALLAIVIRTRREFVLACAVLAAGGVLAILAQGLSLWSPPEWDVSGSLDLIGPATGMCAALALAWVLARTAAGVSPAGWHLAVSVIGIVVITLGSARSVWLGLLIGIVVVIALAKTGRRIAVIATAVPLLVAGVALSVVVEGHRLPAPPSPGEAAGSLEASTTSPVFASADISRHGPKSTQAQAKSQDSGAQLAPGARTGERGDVGPAPDDPASLYPDPGMEAAGTGPYAALGSAPLLISQRFAASGDQSLRAPYGGDLRLLTTLAYVPLQADVEYELAAWVYLPRDWDGGAVGIGTDRTWAGAAEHAAHAATTETGRWIPLSTEVTPVADDVVGGVHIRAASAPSPEASIFVDALTVEPAAGATQPGRDAGGIGELSASFRSSSERVNAEWRLAFWGYMLGEAASQPLLGAGFGRPTSFEWNGTTYDRRTGDPRDPFDVSGPHNSFINLLYRTGVPGLACLVVIMGVALFGLLGLVRRSDGEDRAVAIWLLAGLAITAVVASFTVALEGPFMGIFFWAILGLSLLAPAIIGRGNDGGENAPGAL